MANRIATIMGVLFILIGLAGFVFNNLVGAHLTLAHNLIHLVSGAVSLYIGLKGSPSAAKWFCYVFGVLYLSLAVIGGWLGSFNETTYLPKDQEAGGYNHDMFHMIPGVLELGVIDHVIHIAIAVIYLVGGALTRTKRNITEFLEGNPG